MCKSNIKGLIIGEVMSKLPAGHYNIHLEQLL